MREGWVKDLDGWVCWWVSGGSELGLWIDRVRECWVKDLDGWLCWWLSGGIELGAVDRQGEGDLGEGVGWLGVLVGDWWL